MGWDEDASVFKPALLETVLFNVGDSYLEELENLKAQAKTREVTAAQKKRKKAGEPLRERDPW